MIFEFQWFLSQAYVSRKLQILKSYRNAEGCIFWANPSFFRNSAENWPKPAFRLTTTHQSRIKSSGHRTNCRRYSTTICAKDSVFGCFWSIRSVFVGQGTLRRILEVKSCQKWGFWRYRIKKRHFWAFSSNQTQNLTAYLESSWNLRRMYVQLFFRCLEIRKFGQKQLKIS